MKKIDRLKKWFFKSLGTDNEVGGCIKNEWVSINIQGNIAKEKNLFWEVGDSWKKCWHDSASVPQIWEFLAPPSPPHVQACPHLLEHPPSPCPCGHKTGIIWNIATCEQFILKGKKTLIILILDVHTCVFLGVIQIVRSLRRGGGVIEKWTKTNRGRGS